jgi:deoxycytidylate deaminase
MKILGLYNNLSKNIKRCFDIAKVASSYSNAKIYSKRVGVSLFNGNKLVSIGFNIYGYSHTLYSGIRNNNIFDKCIHAEWNALLKRQYYKDNNLSIFIYRELKNGSVGCSKPCSICQKLINIAGVKNIYYINLNGYFVEDKIR